MYKKFIVLLLGLLLFCTSSVWAQSSLHDIPGEHTLRMYVPQTAAGTDKLYSLVIVPFKSKIVDAKINFASGVTGTDVNYFSAKIINGGSDGTGTTEISTKSYTNGVNASALNPESLTNSSTSTALNLSKDDVLIYKSDQVASGLTDPAKTVEITIQGR